MPNDKPESNVVKDAIDALHETHKATHGVMCEMSKVLKGIYKSMSKDKDEDEDDEDVVRDDDEEDDDDEDEEDKDADDDDDEEDDKPVKKHRTTKKSEDAEIAAALRSLRKMQKQLREAIFEATGK